MCHEYCHRKMGHRMLQSNSLDREHSYKYGELQPAKVATLPAEHPLVEVVGATLSRQPASTAPPTMPLLPVSVRKLFLQPSQFIPHCILYSRYTYTPCSSVLKSHCYFYLWNSQACLSAGPAVNWTQHTPFCCSLWPRIERMLQRN